MPTISRQKSEYIEAQKTRLYDYIIRMTGNAGRAESALLESVRIAQHMDDTPEDLDAIRISLYKMARKFSADIWFGQSKSMLAHLYEDHTEGDDLLDLEFAVDDLPSNQKEFLLLYFRYGFTLDQIADLTSKPLKTVSSGLKVAQKNLIDALGSDQSEQIKEFISVPYIKYETQTEDIAALLDEMKEPLKIPKMLIALCIFLLTAYLLWHLDLIGQVLVWLAELFQTKL